jgi:glycosyltransferase involved in cell wall biosynthesis
VAVVVPSLTAAGAERVAATLAQQFAQECDVTIVTMEPRLTRRALRVAAAPPWADRIPPGCRHLHLPCGGSGLVRLVRLAAGFARVARRERFEVVYSFLTWTNVLVTLARLAGGRYVHVASEHAMAQSLSSDGRGLDLLGRTLPLVYRAPHRIVVVSSAARESLLAAGLLPRPDRAVTIPNPVDATEIARLAEAEPEMALPAAQGPVLACVARLHQQKDHQTLLQAMTLLPPSYALILVGDGSLRAELEASVERLALRGRVTFTGALGNPYPVMRRADLVVLPSREEGFGLVAVEAAVLGVPFVGSAVGGLQEVCTTLGQRTFPPGDAPALAAAIRDTLRNPAEQRAAGDLAVRRFAVSQVAAGYLALAGHPAAGRGAGNNRHTVQVGDSAPPDRRSRLPLVEPAPRRGPEGRSDSYQDGNAELPR